MFLVVDSALAQTSLEGKQMETYLSVLHVSSRAFAKAIMGNNVQNN